MIRTITLIAIMIVALACNGCMVIWHDNVFVCTLFKTVDANDLDMIADPNYIQIGSGSSRTNNDKVKASAIISGVPVTVESTD